MEWRTPLNSDSGFHTAVMQMDEAADIQALSYELGEIKICDLRRKAEQALGPKFDHRNFHDAVLAAGTITLPMLERHIDAYVAHAGSAGAPE